jgi:hypothetical protein
VGGDNLYSGVPFATSAALTFGGEPLSAYVTNNDSYEVHQFSATGVLRRILRRWSIRSRSRTRITRGGGRSQRS